jgi:hypothetical protein
VIGSNQLMQCIVTPVCCLQIWGAPDRRRAGCVDHRVRLDVQMPWLFGFLLTARQNLTSCKESGKQKNQENKKNKKSGKQQKKNKKPGKQKN